MGALAGEPVLDRDEGVRAALAPRHLHVRADVDEDAEIDVLEGAGLDVVRLRAVELFGDARPQTQRPREMLLFHYFFHRERRGDLERHAGVVSLAVPGRALDDRVVVRDAWLL